MSYKKYLIGLALVLVLVIVLVITSQFNISTGISNQLGAVFSSTVRCIDGDKTPAVAGSNDGSFYDANYVSIKGLLGVVRYHYDKKVCSSSDNCFLSEAYCPSAGSLFVNYKNGINCNFPNRSNGFKSRSFGNQTAWACKKVVTTNAGAGTYTTTNVATCTDTDGGNNLTQKGTVTTNSATYTDTCSSKKVVENYCFTNIRRVGTYNCQSVNGRAQACRDGACAVFALLPAPGGLTYNRETKYLSWTAVAGASGYSYKYFNTANQQMGNPVGRSIPGFNLSSHAIPGYRFEISTLNFTGEVSSSPAIFYVP